ncbi:MAG: NAD-binding protein [Alistipes sp.]
MKIVIAGAGEMGSHLAKMLSGNGHDITVIDSDQKLLADVASLADVITVEGDSTTFAVLRKASVRRCDLFIAVNHIENDNVVAAMLAKQLGAKKSIAHRQQRIPGAQQQEIFIEMGIDYLFYPEKVAARSHQPAGAHRPRSMSIFRRQTLARGFPSGTASSLIGASSRASETTP